MRHKKSVRDEANTIVEELFKSHAVPRLINSGRLYRFGITNKTVDLKEAEAETLLWMLERPEKTVEMYNAGKIVTHLAIAIEAAAGKENQHKKRFIHTFSVSERTPESFISDIARSKYEYKTQTLPSDK